MNRKVARTGFDRYFTTRMKEREFSDAYVAARAEIDSVDSLIRALDGARGKAGLSKAELARRMRTSPEAVRRLFTTQSPNPTLATVMNVVRSIGYRLALVPARSGRAGNRRAA